MERKSKNIFKYYGVNRDANGVGNDCRWLFLEQHGVYLLALVNCTLIYYNSTINLSTPYLQGKMWYKKINSVWASAIGFILSIEMWVWFKTVNKNTLSEKAINIASIVMFISFACVFLVYIIEGFSLLILKVLEIRKRKIPERLK